MLYLEAMINSAKTILTRSGNKEAIVWILALAFLAWYEPSGHQHFTLCAFHWVGFESCLGCGIGRSIAHLLNGDISASWQMHYFGIPATLILIHRITYIIYTNYFKQLKPRLE